MKPLLPPPLLFRENIDAAFEPIEAEAGRPLPPEPNPVIPPDGAGWRGASSWAGAGPLFDGAPERRLRPAESLPRSALQVRGLPHRALHPAS